MTKKISIAAIVALAGALSGIWWISQRGGERGGDRFASCRASAIVGGTGVIGGPFTLVDETGATVSEADVIDRPSLIYFGYTFCPDVCPVDAARNADVIDLLAAKGYDVKPIFITIDPARDTPEVLADFTDNLHEKMVGLTGSAEQVRAAANAYRTVFQSQKQSDDEEFYLVNHMTFSYFISPEHGFLEFFRREAGAEQMAEKMGCFLDQM